MPDQYLLCSQDDKDAFYIADLGDVLKKHLRWYKALPRVSPFYAVKCNDSIAVVKILAALGAGFDCASKVSGFLGMIDSALRIINQNGNPLSVFGGKVFEGCAD